LERLNATETETNQPETRKAFVLLSLLDETNLKLLLMLRTSPLCTRELAKRLGMAEPHVSQRIRALVGTGLVRDEGWVRLGGRNLKLYSLKVRSLKLDFQPERLALTLESALPKGSITLSYPTMRMDPPKFLFKFIGRTEQKRILNHAKSAVVWGIAGIGKTTLVASWSAQLRKNGTKVFWHTIKTGDSLALVCTKLAQLVSGSKRTELLKAIESFSTQQEEIIFKAVDSLKEFKGVFVFDDYQNCADQNLRKLVRELLASGSKLIVCSRTRPEELVSLNQVSVIELDAFNKKEVFEFLRSRLPEYKDLSALLSACSPLKGHPLALEVFCNGVRHKAVSRARSLEEFFEEVLDSLSSDEKLVLSCVSLFRRGVEVDAIKHTLPRMTSEPLRKVLRSLEKKGFVKRMEDGFVVHELLKQTGYGNLENPALLHRKAAEWYSNAQEPAYKLEEIYHSFLSQDYGNAIETLVKNIPKLLDFGFWPSLHATLDELLPKVSDDIAKAWLEYAKALCAQDPSLTGNETLSLLNRVLVAAERNGDFRLQARAHLALAQAFQDFGEIKGAKEHYALSLKTAQRTQEYESIRANALQSLAELELAQENYTKALKAYTTAERLQTKLGNERNALLARCRIALINCYIDQPETSLVILDEIRERVSALSNHTLKISWHMCATFAFYALGRLKDALSENAKWVQAAKLSRYPGFLSEAQAFRAFLLALYGRTKQSEKCVSEAEKIKKLDYAGVVEMAKGALCVAKGKYKDALKHYEKCLEIFKDKFHQALCNVLIARLYLKLGNEKLASAYALSCASLFEKIGAKRYALEVQTLIPQTHNSPTQKLEAL